MLQFKTSQGLLPPRYVPIVAIVEMVWRKSGGGGDSSREKREALGVVAMIAGRLSVVLGGKEEGTRHDYDQVCNAQVWRMMIIDMM